MLPETHTQRALHSIADLLLTGPVEYERPAAGEKGSYRFPVTSRGLPLSDRVGAMEAVFVAKVPGYAGPWLSQYARHRAGEVHGTVAIARTKGPSVDLEIVEDSAAPSQAGGLDESLLAGGRATRARVVPNEQLLRSALREIDRDCLSLLLPVSAPSDAAAASRIAALNRWTVLSGPDDESIVACYQLLKQLFPSPQVFGPADGVRLVFVGCDEPTARTSFDRLCKAADKFLEVPLELACVVRRLEPVRSRTLGSFDCGADAWGTVTQAWLEPQRLERVAPSPEEPLLSRDEIEALTSDLEPAPTVERAAGSVHQPSAPEPALAAVTSEPAPQHGNEAAAQARVEAPKTLTAYITDLKPLQARCPRQLDVELAVDAGGRIHLLLRCAAEEPADTAVRRLLEARLWTAEHRSILALTCPPAPIDADADPAVHLFTAQPRAAAALAFGGPAGAPALRLHLLKPVTLAGHTVEVHEPLN